MKFLNLLFLTLVASNAILPSVDDTENSELASSIDDVVQKYLKQQDQNKQSKLVARAAPVAPAAKITTEAEARSFIKYAGAAYCAQDRVENWSCANCEGDATGKEVKYFSDSAKESTHGTDTAGYLAVDTTKKLIVLSYRGTKNIITWMYNLKKDLVPADLPYPHSEAKIHKGFKIMSNALFPKYFDLFNSTVTKYPYYKVVFTGHSLGGALATLSADKLVRAGVLTWDKVNLITYGQPRVGNPAFADYLDSKPWISTRVTSYGDLVAVHPLPKDGYKHHQHNMHINQDDNTIQCSIYQEDEACMNYSSNILNPSNWESSKTAHSTYWKERINTDC